MDWSVLSTQQLVADMLACCGTARPALVAINGRSGSGKTSLALSLKAADPRVAHLQLDRFHLPLSIVERLMPHTGEAGACIDWRRFRDQVLTPLREGKPNSFASFHAVNDQYYGPMTVPAADMVVCEGTFAVRPELAASYNLRVWVECFEAVRRKRTTAHDRDLGLRWRQYYERVWLVEEERYVMESRPMIECDLLVSGDASGVHAKANGEVRHRWLVDPSSLASTRAAR